MREGGWSGRPHLEGGRVDLDLEDSTWTGKERPESGHEGVICLWSMTDI